MSDGKANRTVTIRSPRGLHHRPWGQFAELAARFDAKVWVVSGSERVEATNMIHLLTLNAGQGTELLLEASGADADEAVDALAEFLENIVENDEITGQQQSP